jgi:hypothetical protein
MKRPALSGADSRRAARSPQVPEGRSTTKNTKDTKEGTKRELRSACVLLSDRGWYYFGF